jgi:hypothetical protein
VTKINLTPLTPLENKIPLPADAHTEVTKWWNALQRDLTKPIEIKITPPATTPPPTP